MTKETPVARAYIDLMHIAMGQISQRATDLKVIGRITEEQHNDITKALDNLGEMIGRALHPGIGVKKDEIYVKVLKKPDDIIGVHRTLENLFGE